MVWSYGLVRDKGHIYFAEVFFDDEGRPEGYCRLSKGGTLRSAIATIDAMISDFESAKITFVDWTKELAYERRKENLFSTIHCFIPDNVDILPYLAEKLRGKNLETNNEFLLGRMLSHRSRA